jgi:thioredoxin-related protein
MKAQIALVVVGAALAACSSTKNGLIMPARQGAGAQVTSVNISLPNRTQFKADVSDIESKMNAFNLTITPVDATCANATNINEIQDYASTPTISAQLQQGCDYDVVLALGQKGGSAAQPAQPSTTAVTYEGGVKQILDSMCVNCHTTGKQFPDLSSYSAAQKLGNRIQARVAAGSMPTSGALPEDQKATIKSWVDGGLLEKDAPATQPQSSGSSASSGRLSATYYKNNKALRIAREQIANQSAIQAKLALQLQDDGKAIGLKIGNGAPATGGASTGGGDQSTAPTTTQPAQPQAQAASIPSDKDFDLVDGSGKTEKLSTAFKGKYMLLDFSQSGCGYCIQRAGEMDQDSQLQKALDGSKCSHATFVPADDLNSWYDAIGGKDTFTGKHSYQLSTGRMGKIVESFGVNFAGTPTFILIDSNGKSVADENGVPSDAINQYCK